MVGCGVEREELLRRRLIRIGDEMVATDRLGSAVYKFGTGLAVGNGGFETGVMAPWAPYGGAQHTITMTPHSGSYALRQTIATTEGGAYQAKGSAKGQGAKGTGAKGPRGQPDATGRRS